VQAALADLRLPELPPPPSATWFRRPFTRVNPLSLDRLEYNPALAAYWRSTRRIVGRLEIWRLNPLKFTWNLVRGARQTLVFLVTMRSERY
jgi:hypothetical protein